MHVRLQICQLRSCNEARSRLCLFFPEFVLLVFSSALLSWNALSSQVVIGDLGCLQMADPYVRLRKKMRLGDSGIRVCTPNYRPPDVWLGSQMYQCDLDMWSFGCTAAEIYSRQILITSAATAKQPKQFLEAIAAVVPGLRNGLKQHSCPASWLEQLPLFKKWYGCSGHAWLTATSGSWAATAKSWPPECLKGCPEGLAQLIQECLVWHPPARVTAAEAQNNSFLRPPGQWPLHVTLATQPGKNGVGTIAQSDLDPDLLRYLQLCPSWNSLAKERLRERASGSKCIAAEEAARRLKTEIPGFVDEETPPSASA